MSKTIPLFLTLALLVGNAAACPPTPPPEEQAPTTAPIEETLVPATPWSVRYADGSGNVTRLWQDTGDDTAHFETAPVTPETSSSGTYSGGTPRSGKPTVEQVDELWRRVREMEAESSLHTEARTMGSGSFAVNTPDGLVEFKIQRCDQLEALDSFLQALASDDAAPAPEGQPPTP